MQQQRRRSARRHDADPSLTARQSEVAGLVASGLSNREIARKLGITEQAVKQHVSHLLVKFRVRSRTALVHVTDDRALAAREEDLRGLFVDAPAMILITRGPEHVVEFANPALLEAVGSRDVVGRRSEDVYPELRTHGLLEIADRVYATGQAYVAREFQVRTGRRDAGWLNFAVHPHHDPNGAIGGLIVFIVDVTDAVRRRREGVPRDRRIDALPAVVVVVDGEGRVVFANDWYRSVIGSTPIPSEALPTLTRDYDVRDARTGAAVPTAETVIVRALAGETVTDAERTFRLPGAGSDVRIRVSAMPLRGPDRRVVGAILAIEVPDADTGAPGGTV